MSGPTDSFLKVHYELRPAKQVERRMLVDAFVTLAGDGLNIRDYQYTGMGSIYFIDYIMFHKLLGLTKLVSYEWSPKATRRAPFNSPYGIIEVVNAPIGDGIAKLSKDSKHILWLDYDDVLNSDRLSDIALAGSVLSPGSIVLVTVDAEGPGPKGSGAAEWAAYFKEHASLYVNADLPNTEFAWSRLPQLNAMVIQAAVRAGLATRRGVEFSPLFNFVYADGHRMCTVGGMIVTPNEKRRLAASPLMDAVFTRMDLTADGYTIKIPKLTRKERMVLDAAMPCAPGWVPQEFEMDPEDVTAYREIYRFFPAYAELLL